MKVIFIASLLTFFLSAREINTEWRPTATKTHEEFLDFFKKQVD